MSDTTVLITPRDRYTGVLDCIETLYQNTPQPFDLLVLDIGYPKPLVDAIQKSLARRDNARLVPLGRMIPMEAFARVRESIKTKYVVLLDNDSRVTENWLSPLVECAESGAALVTPLILEREGLDKGAHLRNHIYTSELRVVDVKEVPYLIEHKTFRREVPEKLPKAQAPTDLFELHCVLIENAVFQQLDLPLMVIREHIDMAMQIHAMGRRLMAEPRSVIVFDNLNERLAMPDVRFFFYRWSRDFAHNSSRSFEKRWGYNFYSEQFMMNWIVRRKVYLLARWLWLPSGVANKMTSVYKKLFLKDWDPVKNAVEQSRRLYETLPGGIPLRRDAAVASSSAPRPVEHAV